MGQYSREQILDLAALEQRLPEMSKQYATGSPFPHIVIDDFLLPEIAERAMAEFPPGDPKHWINYLHMNEKKFANREPQTWGPTLQLVAEELNSPAFVEFLCNLTGIDNLIVDESMEGGGLHQSLAGGFLNVHADFTVHPARPHWRRRVNIILYLNSEWEPEYGGGLELWTRDVKRCEKTVQPVGNRVIIFSTDADAFHGHPEPLRCPEGMARRSMALYYFTEEENPLVRSTEYRSRPGERRSRSALIYLDKQVLRMYDRAKRRLGISDQRASQIFERVRRSQKDK